MTDNRGELEAEIASLRERIAELQAGPESEAGRERLMTLFDSMFEGIQIVDFEYRYFYLNKTATEHLGLRKRDAIGKPLTDCFPGLEHTNMYAALRECMISREYRRFEEHFSYPNGQDRWFELSFNPVPAGVLVFSMDVTERQRIRENLSATLNCVTEGIITTNLAGEIERMNPAAEKLIGHKLQDISGKPVDNVIHLKRRGSTTRLDRPLSQLLRDENSQSTEYDLQLLRDDGSSCPVRYSAAPLRYEGHGNRVGGLVIAMRDKTEETRLNDMLRQAQKMEAIGKLAGGIAHDFNNYLMLISGYCQVATEQVEDNARLLEDLEQINAAANSAAALTGQLLAYSRRKVLRPEVLDINATILRVESMLRRLIGEDIELVSHLDPDLDAVEFDPGQVEQILMNLAVNARDAMPRGGQLTIETRNVTLDETYVKLHSSGRIGPHVLISITDTGEGMPPEVLERIFEPFFTTKEQGRGTGLGLSTVHGIVNQSGGSIWPYSEPGHGTSFKIYVPAVGDKPHPQESELVLDTRGGNETILVVEDQSALRTLLHRILTNSGYRVLTSDSAASAISMCHNYAGEIDLLLTDVIMPGMDGVELSSIVRQQRPAIRVVYMSGYSDLAVAHQGVVESGSGFIEKPVSKDVLLAKIREYLTR